MEYPEWLLKHKKDDVASMEDYLLTRFRAARMARVKDIHRPLYHFYSPECHMNDPNGLCYRNGNWHLFYQAYPPETKKVVWGHAVSKDMIHWKDYPYAIYPGPGEYCCSGNIIGEENRAIAMYHARLVGSFVAISKDDSLKYWHKVTGKQVIDLSQKNDLGVYHDIQDPCIWTKDGVYYAIINYPIYHRSNDIQKRGNMLFRSKNLADWQRMHEFVEDDDIFYLLGDDGACPYFLPIGKEGRYMLMHFSHMSGAQATVGEYDRERDKFVPSSHFRFNFGRHAFGGTAAPSCFPDGNGNLVTIFCVGVAKETEDYNEYYQIMSLPRLLSLEKRDELRQKPYGDIESLRFEHWSRENIYLAPNSEIVVDGIQGNSLEIVVEIEKREKSTIEMNVLRAADKSEYTRIVYYGGRHRSPDMADPGRFKQVVNDVILLDNAHSSTLSNSMSCPPEAAPMPAEGNDTLKLRIFIDKSVVEVFANQRQCVALRAYPKETSVGVSFQSIGNEARIKRIDAYRMKSIYDDVAKQVSKTLSR